MDSNKHIPLYLIGLIVAAIQIIGFALLWNKVAGQQEYVYLPTESSPGTTVGASTTPIAVTKFPTESTLREIIQSVLKQELASYTRQLAAAPEATQKVDPVDPPGVKENSPANVKALNESTSVVTNAIAQRKWTLQDTAALLPHVHELTLIQRSKLMYEIATAVNRQELVLEAPVPAL